MSDLEKWAKRASTTTEAEAKATEGLDKWVHRKIGKSGTALSAEEAKSWTQSEKHLDKYVNDFTMQMNASTYSHRADRRQEGAMYLQGKALSDYWNAGNVDKEGKRNTDAVTDEQVQTNRKNAHAQAAKAFKTAENDHIKAAAVYRAAWADHLAIVASHEAHFGEGDHFKAMQLHRLASKMNSTITPRESNIRADMQEQRREWEAKNKDAKNIDELVAAAQFPKYKEIREKAKAIQAEKSKTHTDYANDHAMLSGSGVGASADVGKSEKPFPSDLVNRPYLSVKDQQSMRLPAPTLDQIKEEAKYVQAKIDMHLREAAICRAMAEAHTKESKKATPAFTPAAWDEAGHPRDERGRFVKAA